MRTRLFSLHGAVIAVIGFVMIALAGLTFQVSRERGIEKLHKKTQSAASLFGARLFAPADKYSYLPKLIANYRAVREGLRHANDPARIHVLNVFLDRANIDAESASIHVMDRSGMTIAASNWNRKDSFIGNNYGYRPYFIDALHGGQGRFYAVGATTGIPGYFVASPVKDGNTVLGVVVVKIDGRDLMEKWDSPDHEMMVTDEHGIVFLSSKAEWMYRPLMPLARPALAQLRSSHKYADRLTGPLVGGRHQISHQGEWIGSFLQRVGETGDSEQVSYFVNSADLAGTGWKIHILTPMAEANAVAAWSAIVTAAIFLLLTLSCLYIWQARQRRLEREQAQRTLEQRNHELQEITEQLRMQSITDPLTGAFNRRYVLEYSSKLINAADRHCYPICVALIDVDHFKQINDVHGHPAGDKVLQTLARLYQEELRQEDIFARFGGEEFLMVLPYTDEHSAYAVAERLRQKVMSHKIAVDGKGLGITVSTGISLHRAIEAGVDAAIRRADQALYEAKRNGRNRVMIR